MKGLFQAFTDTIPSLCDYHNRFFSVCALFNFMNRIVEGSGMRKLLGGDNPEKNAHKAPAQYSKLVELWQVMQPGPLPTRALPLGAIKIHRIIQGINTGHMVNPDNVKAQLEGATVWPLSAAIWGEITIDEGRVL